MILSVAFSILLTGDIGVTLPGYPGHLDNFKEIDAPVTHVHIPKGFDHNDHAQIILTGHFKNNCQSSGRARAVIDVENQLIRYVAKAYESEGPCLQVKIPFLITLDLGALPEGEYRVEDALHQMPEAKLKVVEARKREHVDDFLYAPIDSLFVRPHKESGIPVMTLHGTFLYSCMTLKPEKIYTKLTSPDLLEIFPVVEVDNENCKEGEYPFFVTRPLPKNLAEGVYLFHVRVMNGHALNQRVRVPHYKWNQE